MVFCALLTREQRRRDAQGPDLALATPTRAVAHAVEQDAHALVLSAGPLAFDLLARWSGKPQGKTQKQVQLASDLPSGEKELLHQLGWLK